MDSGKEKGMTLKDYLEKHKEVLGKENELSIMIKFIDSFQSSSIQVHPNDEYALKVEGQLGKTEMWYVLDTEDDSYIYYGLNREVTVEELLRRIQDNTILEVLNKVKTHKGDCFLIEAGTIHSIGSGNLICEIQENSNCTYRIYDYNRKDSSGNLRSLDIDKAMDVARLTPIKQLVQKRTNEKQCLLGTCKYFESSLYTVEDKCFIEANDKYHAITILEGNGKIDNMVFKKGDSFLIPANYGEYKIEGQCKFIKTVSNQYNG